MTHGITCSAGSRRGTAPRPSLLADPLRWERPLAMRRAHAVHRPSLNLASRARRHGGAANPKREPSPSGDLARPALGRAHWYETTPCSRASEGARATAAGWCFFLNDPRLRGGGTHMSICACAHLYADSAAGRHGHDKPRAATVHRSLLYPCLSAGTCGFPTITAGICWQRCRRDDSRPRLSRPALAESSCGGSGGLTMKPALHRIGYSRSYAPACVRTARLECRDGPEPICPA